MRLTLNFSQKYWTVSKVRARARNCINQFFPLLSQQLLTFSFALPPLIYLWHREFLDRLPCQLHRLALVISTAVIELILVELFHQFVHELFYPISAPYVRVGNCNRHGMGKTFIIRIEEMRVSMGTCPITTVKLPVDNFIIVCKGFCAAL